MAKRVVTLAVLLWTFGAGVGRAQQCLHDQSETTDQAARRRDALTAARNINNIEWNQPGSAARSFLRHADLESAPFVKQIRQSTNVTTRTISLSPNADIMPGWRLTLDVSDHGYWFMIKDTTDPCGFAYVSNESGVIFRAEPIR
jgi:hypothetical protein